MMNRQDEDFVRVILGSPGEGRRWRALFRKGSLLTLTRDKARAEVPDLYRPQRPASKVILRLIRFCQQWRLPIPGSGSLCFGEEGDCLVTKLEREIKGEILALLLGNPVQEQRRFLALYRPRNGGDLAVLKCGFTARAVDVIEGEERLLSDLGGKVDGVPTLQAVFGGKKDGYRAFTLPYVGGKSASTREALQLLWPWLSQETRSLKHFDEWGKVREVCQTAGIGENRLELAGKIELKVAVCHGDYAPWNLFFDHAGKLWAFDWEAGQAAGIPGLDWVHYLYQIEKHLAGRDFESSLLRIRKRLEAGDSCAFLKAAGWGGHLEWLLITYLATHWLIDEVERPQLIKKTTSI